MILLSKIHLSTNPLDTPMIKSMKTCMLAKMDTRYNSEQIKILKTCSMLDVRYKSSPYLVDGLDQFMKDVKEICEDDQESQYKIPPREGQDLHSISSILEGTSSNAEKSLFDFEDDVI